MSENKLLEDLKEYGVSNRLYNAMNYDEITYDYILPDTTKCMKFRYFGDTCYNELIRFLIHKGKVNADDYDVGHFNSPKKVRLYIKLPLNKNLTITNPIYIPKLKETFGIDFDYYFPDKANELWKMDDEAPFEVTGYYTRLKKDVFEIHIEVH
tara:strand:- start:6733 stop:7191 length:459 start_codon:yes stop_codon:yes gene_type:complete